MALKVRMYREPVDLTCDWIYKNHLKSIDMQAILLDYPDTSIILLQITW